MQTFDLSKNVEFTNGAGRVIGEFRFPTDQEAVERQWRRKLRTRYLGRGMSETITPDSSEFDAQLIKELGSVELDGYEAGRIVDELCRAHTDDIVQEGDAFRVTLRVFRDIMTEHVIGMPTAKQMFAHSRRAYRRIDKGSISEITINLQASGDLYDEVRRESSGYNGDVPVYHKAEVIRAAIEHIEAGFGAAGDENF